jgi:hypothetical protein
LSAPLFFGQVGIFEKILPCCSNCCNISCFENKNGFFFSE